MRDQLAEAVRRRYGAAFSSKKDKGLLDELVLSALDRYDEEIRNGATESEAYDAALASVGDLDAPQKSNPRVDAEKRNRIICFAVVGTIVAGLIALCLSIVIKRLQFDSSNSVFSWLLFVAVVILLLLIGCGVLRLLLRRGRIAFNIVLIVIGVHLLIYPAFFLMVVGVSNDAENNPVCYDYTSRTNEIVSVSYVRVTAIETYAQGSKSDVFEYTVLKKLDSVPTETILNDLAALKYRNPVGLPFFVKNNQEGIVLQFKGDSNDLVYVLYCQYGYVVVSKCDRGINVDNYGPYCDERQWNQLMETYVSGSFSASP